MKYITILLFFSISLHSQEIDFKSFTEKYDLEFTRMGNSGRGKWIEKNQNCVAKKEKGNSVCLSYKPFEGLDNSNMNFIISRIIALPPYQTGAICDITLYSKSENLTNVFLIITSFDEQECIVLQDSILIGKKTENMDSISFLLTHEKVLKISITYPEGNQDPEQKFYPDKITLKINGKDIGYKNVYETDSLTRKNLNIAINKNHIIPLTSKDKSLLPIVSLVQDKKLIGLGECTHGSLPIKKSIYHLTKTLIKNGNVKLVMVERPMDLLLKYDLFVLGYTPKEYTKQLEEDAKCYVDDYKSFLDFLIWLRNYNKKATSKVHFIGIDGLPVPQLALYQYHINLLGQEASLPYLKLIKNKKYLELIELAEASCFFKEIDKTHFEFYRFVIESCNKAISDGRELNMAQNARKAIQIFTKENEKAIIHMHSAHLESRPLIYNTNLKDTGFFLKEWFGSNFFTISFQIGKGIHTNEQYVLTEQLNIPLITPMPQSFESVAEEAGLDYFFYPSEYLGKELIFYNHIPRATINQENDIFGSVRNRFNGYVYIKYSTPLENIEPIPIFYMSGYVQKNTRKIEENIIDKR